MIDLNYIQGFYPPAIAQNTMMQKHMVKEYVELLALEWLSKSVYSDKLIFIGGTNLRLVQGIDRFSEDLDFDCKNLDKDSFIKMTDSLVGYLRLQGLNAEIRDKHSDNLIAFRRNIIFPELLFNLNLTGHREERFLLKIEAQDQDTEYKREMAIVQRLGFYFPIASPSLNSLLSMKLTALLARQKGRDFYDVIFLWQRTTPDFHFLKQRCNISDDIQLKQRLREMLNKTNLEIKKRDFEHLLFNPQRSEMILQFAEILHINE